MKIQDFSFCESIVLLFGLEKSQRRGVFCLGIIVGLQQFSVAQGGLRANLLELRAFT